LEKISRGDAEVRKDAKKERKREERFLLQRCARGGSGRKGGTFFNFPKLPKKYYIIDMQATQAQPTDSAFFRAWKK